MYINPKSISNAILARAEQMDRSLKRKSLFTKSFDTVPCNSCKRSMSKKTADIQIENKRENAPICVACIMGKPRRSLRCVIESVENINQIRSDIKNHVPFPEEKRDGKEQRVKSLDELSNR